MKGERKTKGFYRRSSAKHSLKAGKMTHWSKSTLKCADLHMSHPVLCISYGIAFTVPLNSTYFNTGNFSSFIFPYTVYLLTG